MKPVNHCSLDQVLEALTSLSIPHRLVGPARPVVKVCSLLHKEPRGVYYYSGEAPGPFDELVDSVVICTEKVARATEHCSTIAVDRDPQVVFYLLCGHLFRTAPLPGVHPTAIVHPDAEIGERVHIGPYAVIGRARIGDDTVIHAHVVVMDGCEIGRRVVVEPNSCIGATGVAWIWGEEGERIVLPQIGGVRIGDDVFLGTDVSVVRGMINELTVIGDGTMIAHGSKIGHSAVLGAHCHLANNVSIAGSVVLGDRCFLGSGAVVRPHAKLAAGTVVGVGAAVIKDVLVPDTTVAGVPASAIPAKAKQRGVPSRPRDQEFFR
jgi:UDP-3-O-[3-hydroxymyristoyl] glucosamine N-acyltransferase